MKQRVIISAFAAMVIFSYASAHVLRVPADYLKIQLAVNAAVNGDTVVVSPGTYFENVIFRGKKILLTSRYYESGDVSFILSTVINGSKPAFSDTTSCVLFINHEDSTSILQGFTLTGGGGTAWTDEHGAGIYREGGGVLSALSSPTICHNLIVDNAGINANGTLTSGGGGGMRCGDGTPHILNNVIMSNKGMYGGGIVLNYCDGAIVKNNIVFLNKVDQFTAGKQTFDGGGIWINNKLSASAKPDIIENNTIFANSSAVGSVGGLLVEGGASVTVRNNIIWNNHSASQPGQVSISGATVSLTYNDIMATTAGTGNITVDPGIADSSFYLLTGSSCIDAGDPSTAYNDVENSGSPGTAMWPSQGGLRNDMGAYGGNGAAIFPNFNRPSISFPATTVDFGYIPPPGNAQSLKVYFLNNGTKALRVDSVGYRGNVASGFSISIAVPRLVGTFSEDSIVVSWTPGPSANIVMTDTILVYHNDTTQLNPARVVVTGKSFAIAAAQDGVMYAFSGPTDGAKMYTADTSNAQLTSVGSTNYSDILTARINPLTKEIVALAVGSSTQLIRVSPQGAQNASFSTLTLSNPRGMAFTSDGTLYIAVFGGGIYSVNLNTGAGTLAATTSLHISGLAFNPLNGTLWASVRPTFGLKDSIYTIDLATGNSTAVGATGFGVSTKDLTFDNNGRLFGVLDSGSTKQSYLISINTTNGKGKIIGGMGVNGIETIELRSYYITAVQSRGIAAPSQFSLDHNFPNPFNPATRIRFAVAKAQLVRLSVYDILGREVTTLINEQKLPGNYEVEWNASSLASGIYFCRMQAGSFVQTRKMILMK